MHPELISIGSFTIHTYGFMIMIGALLGYFYISATAKKELNISPEKIQNLAVLIILAAFIGGKLFFYFEKPGYYFNPPANMLKNIRQGFVFYGSLLFVIPVAVWYFRKEKWPVWPFMDHLAIAATLIHASGRLGCFFAGCCYGLPTDSIFGVTYTDPLSQAEPLHVALHPTQLYESFYIFTLFIILLMVKRHKKFDGQLFLSYIVLYAIGRGVLEIFRGDISRGFIIDEVLSHSQFISILLIIFSSWLYYRLYKQGKLLKKKAK